MRDNKLFDSYIAYELLYENNISKNNIKGPIFPDDWYRINNYQVKIDILIEAIDNNVLIINTNKYQDLDI